MVQLRFSLTQGAAGGTPFMSAGHRQLNGLEVDASNSSSSSSTLQVSNETGRSSAREDRRRGLAITGGDALMIDAQDWEEYRNRNDDMSDDEEASVESMDYQITDSTEADTNDAMSVDANEEESHGDPMDEDDEMDEDDPVEELAHRISNIRIEETFFEEFFSNVAIDERGRTVRRSPRLGNLQGSYQSRSGDGHYLVWQSARLAGCHQYAVQKYTLLRR